ncbi:helix-turn-helix domain-containing protein [Sphingobacterium lactis]|uniref:helix-turn-helix domain-containing protein n=1 Tax=Sphingobacterium lactis TaxID=797291 RepID=UPI003F7EBD7E
MKKIITDEAKRFKSFRRAENLTQSEFGELLGKTESWVSRAENGDRTISIDDLKVLNSKLGMSFDWFINGTGKMKVNKKDENLLTTTTDIKNEIKLITAKMDQQDKVLKKLVRDFYNTERN